MVWFRGHDSYRAIITSEHRFRFSCRLRVCSSHPSCLDCVRSSENYVLPKCQCHPKWGTKSFSDTDLLFRERLLAILEFPGIFRSFEKFGILGVQKSSKQKEKKGFNTRWPATQQDKTKEHKNYNNSLCSRCCTYPGRYLGYLGNVAPLRRATGFATQRSEISRAITTLFTNMPTRKQRPN